jgi:hypothetical protein
VFAELFYGPIAAELRLLADFFRAARELQERHLTRVQDLSRPG